MRKLFTLVAFVFIVSTASAQLDFGVKGGLNVSYISLADHMVSSNNQSGFYIGPTMKFMGSVIPYIVKAGFDLSLLYDQRQGGMFVGAEDEQLIIQNGKVVKEEQIIRQRQIAIPLNFRCQAGLGDFASLLIFAGPQLGVNVGSDIKEIDWEWKTANLSVNVGLGVLLAEHLQVNANYNIACGKTGKMLSSGNQIDDEGKLSAWQVGLAYYF